MHLADSMWESPSLTPGMQVESKPVKFCFLKMSLKTILVSCVRGGILTRMKGLLNLFVILLLFITQVFEDFGAR